MVELEHWRRTDKPTKAQIDALERQVKANEKLVELCEQQRTKEKEISTQVSNVQKVDEKIFNEFKSQNDLLKVELDKARASRDRYKAAIKYVFGVGVLIGAGIVALIRRN